MSGGQVGRQVGADAPSPTRASRIERASLRERIGRWLIGAPPKLLVTSAAVEREIMEKERAASALDGLRFQIISAVNGKIIRYASRDDGRSANRIGFEDSYYVVKEGEDLLGALATCLALDRVK